MVFAKAITMRIIALLYYELHDYTGRIKFANKIFFEKEGNKGDQHLHFKLGQWKKIGIFYILNNISDHVTLLQLMEPVGNMNDAVSAFGKQIFYSNYKK